MMTRIARRIVGAAMALSALGLAVYAMRERPLPVEITQARKLTVREYIAEDAKTRLDTEYIVDMPISGTLERIELKEGDRVEAGACIARVDPFDLHMQLEIMEASVAQAKARITGVDTSKPKPEELESAEVRVRESETAEAISRRDKEIARIARDNAKKEFDRLKALLDEGAVSQSQFDAADRTYKEAEQNLARLGLAESASGRNRQVAELTSKSLVASVDDNEYLRQMYKAEMEGLEAQIAMLKSDLEKTTIVSPISGVVLEKFVEDRRVLAAGTPLLKLGNHDAIEIECDILSEEVGKVKPGDLVEIDGKALQGQTVLGQVKRIYPSGFKKISSLGIEQQRVRTIIAFDNSAVSLRPGTSLDVRIVTGEAVDAVAVPERSTFRSGSGWAVFAVRDGKARLTPVELGLKNDTWAQIMSGLAIGDSIVAEPKNEMRDGARLSPL